MKDMKWKDVQFTINGIPLCTISEEDLKGMTTISLTKESIDYLMKPAKEIKPIKIKKYKNR